MVGSTAISEGRLCNWLVDKSHNRNEAKNCRCFGGGVSCSLCQKRFLQEVNVTVVIPSIAGSSSFSWGTSPSDTTALSSTAGSKNISFGSSVIQLFEQSKVSRESRSESSAGKVVSLLNDTSKNSSDRHKAALVPKIARAVAFERRLCESAIFLRQARLAIEGGRRQLS